MKNVLIRMKHYREHANTSEQGILDYVLAHPEEAAECNIHRLAELCYCSSSTIVRFCRKLGFDGYRDLRKALLCELAVRKQSQQTKEKHLERSEEMTDMISNITSRNVLSLEESLLLIDTAEIQRSVDLIAGCDRLLLFGLGASYLVAQDAYLKFLRVDKLCCCSSDIHSQYIQARNAKPTDAAIIISYSGYTEEMLRCARDLHARKTPIIASTRFEPSQLVQLATCCLYVVATEELFRSGAMSSRISQLNMIDILYTIYFNRDFNHNVKRLEENQISKESSEFPL